MDELLAVYLTPMSRPRTDENKMDLVDSISSERRVRQRWRATGAPTQITEGLGQRETVALPSLL